MGRRIAVDRRHEVGAEGVAERRGILERIRIGLPDQFARQRGMVEPLGQPVDDGRFERVVVQDGRIDEGGQFRLAPHHVFRLAADARPDRIDGIERRLHLILRHRQSSRKTTRTPIIIGAASGQKPGALKPRPRPTADEVGRWPRQTANGRLRPRSRPLRQEFQHAGLKHPVADREHVVAAGNGRAPARRG